LDGNNADAAGDGMTNLEDIMIDADLSFDDKDQAEQKVLDVPQGSRFYFDLETIPHWGRVAEIDNLETPEGLEDNLNSVLLESVESVKQKLSAATDPQLMELLVLEHQDQNRKGVKGAIASEQIRRNKTIESRRKDYSTTPEYCRICCMAFALNADEPSGIVAFNEEEEAALLRLFWKLAAQSSLIVGANHLGFDLPVIMMRSLFLGVNLGFRINRSRFNNTQCFDVIHARWGSVPPKGRGLKWMAKCYGIDIPAGDMDGSKVEETFKEDPIAVLEYCKSDVVVLRRVYHFLKDFV
jgi:hypothetical protein